MRYLLNLILALAVVLTIPAHARQKSPTPAGSNAESRVALVIANGDYKVGALKNPVNDAREFTATLKGFGFEVLHKENLTQNDMKRVIREFRTKIRRGGVGLFYYTGHGIQAGGENYLLPVDSTPTSEEEVEYEAVNVGFVLAQMAAAKTGTNIVVLDACRNNPFGRTFRSTSEGLARMDAPDGTLIAYATAPGSVTSEARDVSSGIYTQELLKMMRVPGLSIEEVFKRVRVAVRQRTRNRQIPWEESSLTGNFYFTRHQANEANPPLNTPTALAKNIKDAGSSGEVSAPPRVELNTETGAKIQANAAALYKRMLSSKKEDYSKTIEEYRAALRSEPDNAFYHNALGHTLRKKSEWDWLELVKEQDKARKKVEKKRMWLSILATVTAAAIAGPGASPPPRMPEWGLPGLPLPPFNIDEEIISELETAVQLDPGNGKYHSDLGMAFFDSRYDAQAIGTEAEEQAKAKAEMAFREAVRLEPNNPIFLSNLGLALNAQNKWAEAETEYRKLIWLEPSNVSHHIGLLKALNGQSKWAPAAQVYVEIKRLKPDSTSKALLSEEIKGRKALQLEIKKLKK